MSEDDVSAYLTQQRRLLLRHALSGNASPVVSQEHVSQQYGPYQNWSQQNNVTSHSDFNTPSVSSSTLMGIPNATFPNTVGNNSTYPSYDSFGDTTYGSNHATSSQTGRLPEASNPSNWGTISNPYTENYADSRDRAIDFSQTDSTFGEGGNAEVAEEDEEDGNEDEEDAESVRMAQDGRIPTRREEKDEDGTSVVIVDAGRKGRGKIGTKNGVDVYFNPTSGKWQEYLTHDSMRGALINKAQAEYPGHPDQPSGGGALYGVTSFFKDHQNWGSEKNRNDLPDCVFKWPTDKERAEDLSLGDTDDDAEDEVRRSQKDYPGPMMWGDKILLDHHNLPVVDHNIPATLSGNTPGSKLQAMRLLNPNITQYDLLARMPRQIERRTKGVVFLKPLGTKNTHINMPMQRFRDIAGCVAGAVRDGSTEITAGLLKFFASHGFDPAESGSTRGFGRNLEPWERKEVKLGNAGKYPRRSGARAVGLNKRKEVHNKMLKTIEAGKTKDAAKAGRLVPNAQNNAVGATSLPSHGQPAQMGTLGVQSSLLGSGMQNPEDLDDGALSKRRRNSKSPGTEVKPPRRYPRIERIHRPQRYGTEGAPAPLASPEQTFGGLTAALGFDDYSGNGQISNAEPDKYPPNGDDHFINESVHQDTYQSFYDEPVPNVDGGSSPYSDDYSGLGLIADYLKQNASDVPTHHPASLRHTPEGYQTRQILGKHRLEEPIDQPHEDVHVPLQSLGEQGPEDQAAGEGDDVPASKRPRMSATEGFYAPPAQSPTAQTLKKAHKSERDAHLPPAHFSINEATPEINKGFQIEAPSTPSLLVMDGSVIDLVEAPEAEDAHLPQTQPFVEEEVLFDEAPQPNVEGEVLLSDEAPQVADAQGQARSDIRDVRPANGWQSQSLHNALRYTRDAYLEWTGEEAPATNREDAYNTQYRALRAAFEGWWTSEMNPQREEPLPELYRMEAWGGAVEEWRAPENMEHLFEAMGRGKWAARNADGSLREPRFRWDYEEFEWWDADDVGRL